MTSKPASRKEAATTLAPRSCPSSPALATSTRILRSKHSLLELGRFVMLAEHHAHRLPHLALGGVDARTVDQERHQVLRFVTRRLGERGQAPRHEIVVTRLAQLAERRHLVLFDLGIDVEDRDL